MKSTDEDRDLQALFTSLRQADRRAAPAFEPLLARPRSALPEAPSTPRALLVAASLFLVLATGARWWWPADQASGRQETTVALIAWQSPTAALLDTPGRGLLSELPTLQPFVGLPSTPDRPKTLAARTPTG